MLDTTITHPIATLRSGRTHQIHNSFEDKNLQSCVRMDFDRKSFHA